MLNNFFNNKGKMSNLIKQNRDKRETRGQTETALQMSCTANKNAHKVCLKKDKNESYRERFCISSQVTLAHLEILLQRGKQKTVKKEQKRLCLIAFSRWISDEQMGKYSRQSNEKVYKQNKKKHKLGNTLAERQTDKERGGYDGSEDRREQNRNSKCSSAGKFSLSLQVGHSLYREQMALVFLLLICLI